MNIAFLSSLGANLRITDDDLLPSPALRPTFDIHHNLPPPSPLTSAIMTDDELSPISADGERDPLDGIPPLVTETATGEDDVVAALKLVADSVAQQRNVAARVLIFHPLNLAIFTILMGVFMQYLYSPDNFGRMLTTATGLIMMALVAVRQVTSGYIFAAEEINKGWLGEDQILVSKFGSDIIAALVLGWEKGEGRGNRRKKWGKGIVRAWTVKMRYRGKGVGTELLEEAVRETQKRGGEELVFADDHASK
jgi:ribosomal protein S18 acetylase RimI-like enzyme